MISSNFQVAVSWGDPPVPQIRRRIQRGASISLDETQSSPTVHHLTANVCSLWFYRGETLNCTTLLHFTAPENRK
jgi:hypothetical protein